MPGGRQRRRFEGVAVTVTLVDPGINRLPDYAAALARGWSPTTVRDVSAEELAMIHADPVAALRHIARLPGGFNRLPDGTQKPWLPGRVFWICDEGPDGGFCGTINLRHVPGTEDLPPHVSGHVGYGVVPWRRGRGIATRALALLLPVAAELGLARVLLTCDVDNVASRRVIEANGGVLLDEVLEPGKAVAKSRFWVPTAAPGT
jgi:predicted acetyltransferase